MRPDILSIGIAILIVALMVVLANVDALMPDQHVAGRMYIRTRGISAEIYTREAEPIDGMSTLWHGGKVTTNADLSTVQLGDMAEIYTVEGEHLVLECIDIRKGLWWLRKPRGDVMVVNGRWVYRFTRL